MIKRLLKNLRSKPALLAMTLIYTFALIVGSTFSWITSSDSKLNQFEAGRLSTQISETFIGSEQWRPGQEIEKLVMVRNTGTTGAIIRVSLSDFLMGFVYDLTTGGTGNLQIFDTETTAVDRRFPSTWAAGQTNEIASGQYYKSTTPLSDLKFGLDVNNRTDILQYFTVIFGDNVYDESSISSKSSDITSYWYFENEWFYYSQVLMGVNARTEPLVKAVKMANEVSYDCQSCLYAMTVEHQSLTPNADGLSDWIADGLINTGDAYDILIAAINAANA